METYILISSVFWGSIVNGFAEPSRPTAFVDQWRKWPQS